MKLPRYFPALLSFYREHGYFPSFREFLRPTRLRSTNAIHKLFQRLARAGLIYQNKAGKYFINQKFLGVRQLGSVEAGWPSPAEEELADTMSLDEFLIGNREATYMLTVSGDSMLDAGIHPGDILLVERGKPYRDGDIVVAEIDGGWTVKYFRNQQGRVYLEAANKKYPPFYPAEELKIAAVVTSVIRKYHSV